MGQCLRKTDVSEDNIMDHTAQHGSGFSAPIGKQTTKTQSQSLVQLQLCNGMDLHGQTELDTQTVIYYTIIIFCTTHHRIFQQEQNTQSIYGKNYSTI